MSYEYDYGSSAMSDEGILMILGVFGVVLLVILVFGLAFWIMRSLSLYTLAKRRGISKPWLSWIPFGSQWILGSLSDQYQHLVHGRIKSRRKILLTLYLLSAVIGVVGQCMSFMEGEVTSSGGMIAMIAFSIFTAGISIASLVFYHMCNYDLYRSCDPKNAVAFLVLGILFSVTEPFFYLVSRKKDLGFPRPEPAAPVCEEPAQLPQSEEQTDI